MMPKAKKLVDLEIPSSSLLVMLHRADGSTTVSVEPEVVETALRRYHQTLGSIAWPPAHLLNETIALTDEVN